MTSYIDNISHYEKTNYYYIIYTPIELFTSNCKRCFIFSKFNKRSYYNLQPLEIDDNLNQEAQDWANYIALNNLFEHEDDHYGETLYSIDKQYYNQLLITSLMLLCSLDFI